MKRIFLFICIVCFFFHCSQNATGQGDDGYQLWMKYETIDNEQIRKEYQQMISNIVIEGETKTIDIIKNELIKMIKKHVFY